MTHLEGLAKPTTSETVSSSVAQGIFRLMSGSGPRREVGSPNLEVQLQATRDQMSTLVARMNAIEANTEPPPQSQINITPWTGYPRVLDSGVQNSVADFTESFNGYPDAIIQGADDRDLDSVLSIASYLDIQARNIAASPDDVFNHPIVTELRGIVAQLLILNNAVDRDRYNSITVLTQQDDAMDLEGATPWVSAYHQKLQADFRDGLLRMPSFGLERDAQVQEYLGHLA
ncbi:hypothetical protein B0H13DRAFT_2339798 [Mycena leptocephala]|nr:hypothetical protein B0H13DRAFT_2339798 [Mycena leptocephala]